MGPSTPINGRSPVAAGEALRRAPGVGPSSTSTLRRGSLRAATLVVVVALCFPAPCARAEDSPTPIPTVPIPQENRKNAQGQAAALAAAGAAFAGAMCLLFLRQAQQAATESERTMYMMMAMQECKQVPESLSKAAENKDGANTMTQPPQAAQALPPEASNGAFPMPTPASDNAEPVSEQARAFPTFVPVDTIPTSGVVAATAFDGTPNEKSDDRLDGKKTGGSGGAVGAATSNLAGIPQSKVGFDETSTNSNPVSTVGAGGGIFGAVGGSGGSGDGKNGDGKTGNDKKDDIGRQASKMPLEAGEGAGGGAVDRGANGKPAEGIDAMLAQLMGGLHGGGDGGTMTLSGGDTLALGGGASGDDGLPNIFEYATLRYRELVDADRLLFNGSIEAHRQPRVASAENAKRENAKTATTAAAADSSVPAPVGAAVAAARSLASVSAGLSASVPSQDKATAADPAPARMEARLGPSNVHVAKGAR